MQSLASRDHNEGYEDATDHYARARQSYPKPRQVTPMLIWTGAEAVVIRWVTPIVPAAVAHTVSILLTIRTIATASVVVARVALVAILQ